MIFVIFMIFSLTINIQDFERKMDRRTDTRERRREEEEKRRRLKENKEWRRL